MYLFLQGVLLAIQKETFQLTYQHLINNLEADKTKKKSK